MTFLGNSDPPVVGPADWLRASLLESEATWNVLAQQVMMGMVGRVVAEGRRYSMDQWPGYARERMRLIEFLADRRVPNPVVLTGDIHSNRVNDLRVDDRKAEAPRRRPSSSAPRSPVAATARTRRTTWRR